MNARDLRTKLNWSQKEMADYLGCDQATVSRIENGQEPSGPIGRLLKLLEAQASAGDMPPVQSPRPSSLGAAAAEVA